MIYKFKNKSVEIARIFFSNKLVKNIFFIRAKYSYKRRKVVFIHIPKAAGTSICELLYGKRVSHFTITEIKTLDVKAELSSLPVFTVIRDPVDRLLSSYNFAVSGTGTNGAVSNPGQYQTPKFLNFDKFLSEWLSEKDLSERDRIFWPQYSFISDGSGVLIDKIFKLESTGSLKDYLDSLGIRSELRQANKTVQSTIARSELSAKQLAAIKKIYIKDFELYESLDEKKSEDAH